MKVSKKLRVVVVGGGPSGFFVAGCFLKGMEEVEVHVFEREAMPFGLVRYGIAPDHEHTKGITRVFERTAEDGRFCFYGHVTVGRDVSFEALREVADVVVVTTGHDRARLLGVEGEAFTVSALDWVNWYNCHPRCSGLSFSWSGDVGVVVGNGNVALDVVRLLGLSREVLAGTDMNPEAVEAFGARPLRRVVVLGRRGPAEVSFKVPELRELMGNEALDLVVDPEDLVLGEGAAEALGLPENRERRKVFGLLEEISGRARRPGARCRVEFVFFRSLLGVAEVEGGGLVLSLACNVLEGDVGAQRCVASGEVVSLEAGLVVTAVGYRGRAVEGLPFDVGGGRLFTEAHRVVDEEGVVLAGVYASGWIKTGPRGLVGNSRQDAHETFKRIVLDLEEGRLSAGGGVGSVEALVEGLPGRVVSWEDWRVLDEAELSGGGGRRKFRSNEDALEFLAEEEGGR